MSREIKFRGLSIHPEGKGEWIHGTTLTNKLGTYIITEKNPHECTQYGYLEIDEYERVDPKTIGQYIGRKDENDDFIFEKDIASVIIQRYVFGFYQETEYVGIVNYDEKECVYYLELLKKPLESGETIPDEIDGIPISSESDEEINRFYFNENIDEADIRILGNIYNNPELLEGKL